jgi:hypothetical protein
MMFRLGSCEGGNDGINMIRVFSVNGSQPETKRRPDVEKGNSEFNERESSDENNNKP